MSNIELIHELRSVFEPLEKYILNSDYIKNGDYDFLDEKIQELYYDTWQRIESNLETKKEK